MLADHETVKSIYRSKYKELTEIFILDPIVICPSLDHMETIIATVHNSMNNLVYNKNKMDCDDFALIMNAKVHLYRHNETESFSRGQYQYSFGEVFVKKQGLLGSGYHMMNSFIDNKLNLFFVEPQNGHIYLYEDYNNIVKEVLHVRI